MENISQKKHKKGLKPTKKANNIKTTSLSHSSKKVTLIDVTRSEAKLIRTIKHMNRKNVVTLGDSIIKQDNCWDIAVK